MISLMLKCYLTSNWITNGRQCDYLNTGIDIDTHTMQHILKRTNINVR